MIMDKFSLQGKVAFVTGGSYGIGLALALGMAEAGAKVAFCDLNADLVNKGLEAYAQVGVTAHGYVCDVTDEARCRSWCAGSVPKSARLIFWSTMPGLSNVSRWWK